MSRASQDRRPMGTAERVLGGAEIEVTAKATRRRFTLDYNTEHHHSALGLLTAADVHHGGPSSAWRRERQCSRRPTLRIRNASRPARPNRQRVPWTCGSTHPTPAPPILDGASHQG